MNICKENTDSLRTAKSASVFSLESFSCSLVWCMHIFVHCVLHVGVGVCVGVQVHMSFSAALCVLSPL